MQAESLTASNGLPLQGPLLFTPKIFEDERGFFYESWNYNHFKELLVIAGQDQGEFVQDNHSRSHKGVLRGLHYQLPPHAQGKLVRCVAGQIFDVVVDLRASSPTQYQWVGVHLSSNNHKQIWVPEGFAHGFLTISGQADVLYKTTDYWNKDCERSIRWNDPRINIEWDGFGVLPKLSQKDSLAPFLDDLNPQELFA